MLMMEAEEDMGKMVIVRALGETTEQMDTLFMADTPDAERGIRWCWRGRQRCGQGWTR